MTESQKRRAQVIITTVADCQMACYRETDLTILREAYRLEHDRIEPRKGILNTLARRINKLTKEQTNQ